MLKVLPHSFFDFTDSLASSARKFIEVELISDGHTALSKQLLSILDKQVLLRSKAWDNKNFSAQRTGRR